MSYKLSTRSLSRMDGIEKSLQDVVKRAIELTKIDFGVSQGLRTVEEQKRLFESGASKTMKSRHLEGRAVDLIAYIDGRVSWEINVYDDIADAVKQAATELSVSIRWGAAWTVPDITDYPFRMEDAMNEYIDKRRSESRRPFIDAPHFELA